MSNELWLVRHGETEWSRSGQHTGSTDLPLLDAGREQAKAAATLIDGHEFALTLCSPLSRARETAAILGFPDPELRDDLHEVDYGDYEGRTTEDIRKDVPGWTMWSHGNLNGETPDAAGRRTDRVIAEALAVDGDVLLVAHGHILRILAARWLEQPAAFGERLHLGTATVSVLGFERDVRALDRWNVRGSTP